MHISFRISVQENIYINCYELFISYCTLLSTSQHIPIRSLEEFLFVLFIKYTHMFGRIYLVLTSDWLNLNSTNLIGQ